MQAGIAVYQNDIFIIGGTSKILGVGKPNAHRTVWKFDSKTNEWQKRSQMHEARVVHSMLKIGSKVFAIGGWNPVALTLRTVEKYDIISDSWAYDTSLPYGLDYSAACVVHNKGYVVGGRSENETYNLVYARNILVLNYDDIFDKIEWQIIDDILPQGIYQHSVTTDGNQVFIMGGTAYNSQVNALIIFDPTSREVEQLQSMPHIRSSMMSLFYDDCIYVIAGWGRSRHRDINGPTNTVLKYSIINKKWEEMLLQLPRSVYLHTCALIHQ